MTVLGQEAAGRSVGGRAQSKRGRKEGERRGDNCPLLNSAMAWGEG
jgi:hypothetical protein